MKSQEFLNEPEQGALTVIRAGALIDGRGGPPLKDPVIVVQGRRIKAVGSRTTCRCRKAPKCWTPKAAR